MSHCLCMQPRETVSTELLDNLIVLPLKPLTIPSVLTEMHADRICLNVLLHQLAAINTRPLSTCVWSSGIWVALSEVCC